MNTMKTALRDRLNTASAAIQTHGQKAFKHPITSILSLCLVAGIAATIAGFSQAPTEKSEVPAATAPAPANAGTTLPLTLPTPRTLTSTDGRTIDVTILSKTDTAIRAARADGKEFEIPLDKLSDADKAFVAGFNNRSLTVFLYQRDSKITESMEKAGFKVTTAGGTRAESTSFMQKLTDEDLNKFDLICVSEGINTSWKNGYKEEDAAQADRLLKLMMAGKPTMWINRLRISKKQFIQDKGVYVKEQYSSNGYRGYESARPYCEVDGNVVFYNSSHSKWDTEKKSVVTLDRKPEIQEEAIQRAKELVLKTL